MMKVTLVDPHDGIAEAARACRWSIDIHSFTDIRDMPRVPGTAFVVPTDALGRMDFLYGRVMFPGIEPVVLSAIAAEGCRTRLGRPFLPVGQALAVPVPTGGGVHLIVAPTMLLPQDVRGTHNAYHAMRAALEAAYATPGVERVVVPGFCTGVGMMSERVVVEQMKQAHFDFMTCSPKTPYHEIMAEQPCLPENREFG